MGRARLPPLWLLWVLPALGTEPQGAAPLGAAPMWELPAAPLGDYEERTVTGVRGRAVELPCGPPGAAVTFWSFAGAPGAAAASSRPRAVALVAAGGRAALAPGAAALGRASAGPGGRLRLAGLRAAAQGRFLCQALRVARPGGRLGASYGAVSLRVLVPVSKPWVRPWAAAAAEGQGAAVLRCGVREGSAPLRFSWRRRAPPRRHRDGDEDDEDDNDNDGDSGEEDGGTWRGAALRLAPAARAHAGWYACTARNEVSSRRSRPAFLDVAYGPDAPVITAGSGSGGPGVRAALAAPEGAALVLRCRAASRPRCRYAWLRDGGRLARGPALALGRLAPAHAGTYACLARNPRLRRRAAAALRLAVQPRPRPRLAPAAGVPAALAAMLLAAGAALLAARRVARHPERHPRLHRLLFRSLRAAPRDAAEDGDTGDTGDMAEPPATVAATVPP